MNDKEAVRLLTETVRGIVKNANFTGAIQSTLATEHPRVALEGGLAARTSPTVLGINSAEYTSPLAGRGLGGGWAPESAQSAYDYKQEKVAYLGKALMYRWLNAAKNVAAKGAVKAPAAQSVAGNATVSEIGKTVAKPPDTVHLLTKIKNPPVAKPPDTVHLLTKIKNPPVAKPPDTVHLLTKIKNPPVAKPPDTVHLLTKRKIPPVAKPPANTNAPPVTTNAAPAATEKVKPKGLLNTLLPGALLVGGGYGAYKMMSGVPQAMTSARQQPAQYNYGYEQYPYTQG